MGETTSLRVLNLRAKASKVVKQIEVSRLTDPIMRRPCADREEKRVTRGSETGKSCARRLDAQSPNQRGLLIFDNDDHLGKAGELMTLSDDIVTLKGVDHEITRRFRMLRFSAPIERKFEADSAQARCRQLIRQNYVGMFVYNAFLYGDYRAMPDAIAINIFVHCVISTPFIVLINIVLARRPPVWLREGIEALGAVVLAAASVLVVSQSQSPLRDVVLLNIVMGVLFTSFVQRVRFWYALGACLASQAIYSIGLAGLVPFSMDRTIMSTCMFVGMMTFILVGHYNLEHEQRMAYLLRLRDHIRNRDLELISLADALTGVGNRRALDAALINRVQESVAGPAVSTAILLLDIDHFKAFNDLNGHPEGDVCLKRVADLLTDAVHDEGRQVYRFGGEEFVVLLENTTVETAVVVAERIRAAVAFAALPTNSRDRGKGPAPVVTISIGVAAGHLDGEAAPAALIAEADRALYAAKRNGRNQVWSALHHDTFSLAPSACGARPRAA